MMKKYCSVIRVIVHSQVCQFLFIPVQHNSKGWLLPREGNCIPPIVHHKQSKLNLNYKPSFTPVSSRVSQTALTCLMIDSYSPLLLKPPLQKGRGIRIIHLTTCNGNNTFPWSLSCQSKSGHNSLSKGTARGCRFK